MTVPKKIARSKGVAKSLLVRENELRLSTFSHCNKKELHHQRSAIPKSLKKIW